MYKILIIEDDLTMAQAIQKEMKMWGNDAQYVQDFKNVLETFAEFDPASCSYGHYSAILQRVPLVQRD